MNARERVYGRNEERNKSMKGTRRRNEQVQGLRYETSCSQLNFEGILILIDSMKCRVVGFTNKCSPMRLTILL
jgi:hypothetical protein